MDTEPFDVWRAAVDRILIDAGSPPLSHAEAAFWHPRAHSTAALDRVLAMRGTAVELYTALDAIIRIVALPASLRLRAEAALAKARGG